MKVFVHVGRSNTSSNDFLAAHFQTSYIQSCQMKCGNGLRLEEGEFVWVL